MTVTPGDLARGALELLDDLKTVRDSLPNVVDVERENRFGQKFVTEQYNPALTVIDEARELVPALAAENTALREALDSLLPGPLCGEAWGLPDTEKVAITVTFGAIRKARALSPTSPHGGDDA